MPATFRSTASPATCPCASLKALKSSMSIISSETGVPYRLRPCHLLTETLVEVAVVVQAGKAVGDRLLLVGAVQPGVLDGHGRLLRKRLRELDLLGGETALTLGLDEDEQADGLVVEHERHVEVRLVAVLLERPPARPG